MEKTQAVGGDSQRATESAGFRAADFVNDGGEVVVLAKADGSCEAAYSCSDDDDLYCREVRIVLIA